MVCEAAVWRVQAFLAASLKTDIELMDWFRERLVWGDAAVVKDLVKSGLFYRIYTPQVCAALLALGVISVACTCPRGVPLLSTLRFLTISSKGDCSTASIRPRCVPPCWQSAQYLFYCVYMLQLYRPPAACLVKCGLFQCMYMPQVCRPTGNHLVSVPLRADVACVPLPC